ncbi:hypothetical protein O181_072592 [Austropuccinia psidii MF-1]|uniref:Uncharacterized protein n=1 Tax=Austropuccinia psidii MF-1 TaxID=1389203 RepID=A0A9Q3F9R1_9BASI|nr:hypothetical protein [Austropuccinia psidii MF-1]
MKGALTTSFPISNSCTNIPAPLTCCQNPPSSKDIDKPSSLEDLVYLVHSLVQKLDSLTSAHARDLVELTNYCSQHPNPSSASQSRYSVYEKFLQAPHHLPNNGPTLLPDCFNYLRWLEAVNTTLFYIFESDNPINDFPAFLVGWPHSRNWAISRYLNGFLHPDVDPLSSGASAFFDTFQKGFSPGTASKN